MTEPWVSVDDVAKHLGVVKDSIYRWIERRGLPAKRVGRLWKFKLSEVDDWVRRGGAEGEDSSGERPLMPSLDVADSHETSSGQPAFGRLRFSMRSPATKPRAGAPQRLTEPKFDTWSRFRGRLTSADFVALLFEDAAVIHRVPFDPVHARRANPSGAAPGVCGGLVDPHPRTAPA